MKISFRDITLNVDKELQFSLLDIYGVGLYKVQYVLSRSGIGFPYFFSNLNNYFYAVIHYWLKNLAIYKVRVQRKISLNLTKLVDIQCYRGVRYNLNLPMRGQRTRTNAGTQRRRKKI